jgi:squalene-hopene/tetraprenyl-beta-curcumene cyclase
MSTHLRLVLALLGATQLPVVGAGTAKLAGSLTFHASFDGKVEADYARGDRRLYTTIARGPQLKTKPGLPGEGKTVLEKGGGRFGDCLNFKDVTAKRIHFALEKNLAYRTRDWSGTVSVWLRTTPDEDLAPGYTDPLQITPRSALDACFFTEFGIEDPRPFRLGAFADKTAWNPDGKPTKEIVIPDRPLIHVDNPPFSRDRWTHVVFTWAGFNSGDKKGITKLYLNGKPSGTMTGWNQQFTWDLAQAQIRLGVKFIGRLDELSCFDRALSPVEIRQLHALKNGVKSIVPKPVAAKPQYEHGRLRIAAASAEEPLRETFSLKHAMSYLQNGTAAWAGKRKCVSCHTTGSYLQAAPSLTPFVGPPSSAMRNFFVEELAELKVAAAQKFTRGTSTAQVVYIAAGLAEWDRHVTGTLSPETREALGFMFRLQQGNGTWQSLDCWPPFESSAYQEATVAAMAAATAPDWLKAEGGEGMARLRDYLRNEAPPHDYGRVLLLWTGTRVDGLLGAARKKELVDLIFRQQRDDGGWSIRTFAQPEEWGNGSRVRKLQREAEFRNPPSDGHMTGLCVTVLRDAGIPAEDARLRPAVAWLLANQRESGRWWTRSLNTDTYHFITYSGTTYPLLALAKCGKLPPLP